MAAYPLYMYYYTPLPLNLANNNNNNNNNNNSNNNNHNKQARHLSVLAVTPSQRLGSFPNLAILFPRWCPCQIQVLSQKLTGGAPGRGCPPQTAHPQNSLFWPEMTPKPRSNGPKKGNGYTTRAP